MTYRPFFLVGAVGALTASIACACSSSTTTTPATGDAAVTAPAHCGFDPVFAAADGGGTCHAARYALICSGDGSVEECVSDDSERCGTDSMSAMYGPCTSRCAANEYAVSCGGLTIQDAGAPPKLPFNCREFSVNPGGGSIACCPCE